MQVCTEFMKHWAFF